MYKYTKNLIGLLLLTMLTNSCGTHSGTKDVESTEKITLSRLQTKLESGPIIIGEEHTKPFAREAISALIKSGKVKALFLELADLSNGKKDDKEIAEYLGSKNRQQDISLEGAIILGYNGRENVGRKNPFKMGDFIKAALAQKNISVYFHDVPEDNYGQSLINGEYRSSSYAASPEGVRERNKYSKGVIKNYSTGVGTVILAGQDHMDAEKLGQEHTLQALLGYGNDQIFDLSGSSVVE